MTNEEVTKRLENLTLPDFMPEDHRRELRASLLTEYSGIRARQGHTGLFHYLQSRASLMNKKNLTVAALVLGSVLAVFATQNFLLKQPPSVEIGPGSAEIAKFYATPDELFDDSVLVVIGVFEDEQRILEANTPRNPAAIPPYYPGNRQLAFKVADTLKGESEDRIWVAQYPNRREDTLFQPGSRYVLFLNPSVSQVGEFFWPTGATQGAFPIINDKVYSRNVVGEIPESVGPTVEGVPLDQFIKELKK